MQKFKRLSFLADKSLVKYYLAPAFFFIGTVVFIYLYLIGPEGSSHLEREVEGTTSYLHVQKLKEQARIKLDLKKQKALLEQSKRRAYLEPKSSPKENYQLHLGEGQRDLSHDEADSHGSITLDQQMDEFLAKKQSYEALEQAQRKRYVERFIEEARAMGYDVKVDDDMQIISAEKIK